MRNFTFATPAIVKRDALEKSVTFKNTLPALFMVGCTLLTVTACQKPDKSQDHSDIKVSEITPSETTVDDSVQTDQTLDSDDTATETKAEKDAQQSSLVGDDKLNKENANNDATAKEETSASTAGTAPLKEGESEAFLEKQITDVEYRSANEKSIKVTFRTSALEALEADVKLPSGKRVVLTAAPNQGNNPTYQSKDGSIELVTHGGGGSIDLISNGKSTSFDAVSAEAEVVSPTP